MKSAYDPNAYHKRLKNKMKRSTEKVEPIEIQRKNKTPQYILDGLAVGKDENESLKQRMKQLEKYNEEIIHDSYKANERVKELEELFTLSQKGVIEGDRWEYLKQKLGL